MCWLSKKQVTRSLQELADRVGGTWHIETADPEAGTIHTIHVYTEQALASGP